MTIGQHRDAAVVLGSGDAPIEVLAGEQPALAIDGVAIGMATGVSKHRDRPIGFVPPQQSVIGDVAPDQVAPCGKPGRPFGPAATCPESIQPRVTHKARCKFGFDDLKPTAFNFAVMHEGAFLKSEQAASLLKAESGVAIKGLGDIGMTQVDQEVGLPLPIGEEFGIDFGRIKAAHGAAVQTH